MKSETARLFLAACILFAPITSFAKKEEILPLVGFFYGLEVDGRLFGYFTEVSGLGSESEVIIHKTVDPRTGREITQKVPGRLIWTDITLKRGITNDRSVWDWRALVLTGNINEARKNATIVMYDSSFGEISRFDILDAWPSKIEGLKDGEGTEELTIVHEGVYRSL